MMRVGIDNVAIARIKSLNPHFAERILSERELAEYRQRSEANRDSYLAGRFACKEAYVKASGRKKVKYSLIETLDDENGAPVLYVEGKRTGAVSITHDVIATAIVILDDQNI